MDPQLIGGVAGEAAPAIIFFSAPALSPRRHLNELEINFVLVALASLRMEMMRQTRSAVGPVGPGEDQENQEDLDLDQSGHNSRSISRLARAAKKKRVANS